MADSPEGVEVEVKAFNKREDQIPALENEIMRLIEDDKVEPGDIMILTNNTDRISTPSEGIKLWQGFPLKASLMMSLERVKK